MASPSKQPRSLVICDVADVIFAEGQHYHCRIAQRMVMANKSVSLLIDPVPGDCVFLACVHQEYFITAILKRQEERAVLSLPHDAKICADSLHIRAQHCTAEYELYQCFSAHHHTITKGQQLQKATLLSQQAEHIGLTAGKVLVNS